MSEEIEPDTDVDPAERADRPYWERKAAPQFLATVDRVVALLRANGLEPRVTYNRHHLAVGTTGYNFCWFHPRRLVGSCHIECRLPADSRDQVINELQSAGVDASPLHTDRVGFTTNLAAVEAHQEVIVNVLKLAEQWSQR